METFAPIFNGFYETAYSFDVDSYDATDWLFNDNEFTENQKNFCEELIKRHYERVVKENYTEYETDVAKAVCEFLTEKVTEMLGTKVEFEFQNIYSPKYYNFRNDSINVKLHCDTDVFMKNLLEYIKNHLTDFKKYIESNYTSYDGFMSFYSNDVNDWLKSEYNDHEIGSLLEFALREYYENIETEMMYFVLENVYACSYIELQEDFQELIDDNKLDDIFKEFDRLTEQKNNYIELMVEQNKNPNWKVIEKQEKKNLDDMCNDVIKLLEK